MSKKIPIYYSLPAILLSTFLMVIIVLAWTEPTASPPGGNVPAPINVGGDSQIKSGRLGIGTLSDVDTNYMITTQGGGIKAESGILNHPAGYFSNLSGYAITTGSGNVGIGTTTPDAKLVVAGQIKITGGSPAANKVLTSSNTQGLASWQDPTGVGDNLGNHIATQALNMSSWKVINVLTPTASSDAANKAYVDAQTGGGGCYTLYGGTTCATGYTAVVSGYTTLYGYAPATSADLVGAGGVVCSPLTGDTQATTQRFQAMKRELYSRWVNNEPCRICCK